MAGSIISLISSVQIDAVEVSAPAVGANTVAYLVTASPSDVTGRLYRSAAQVDADTDLVAADKTAIKAMIAVGGQAFGGVYTAAYDLDAGPPAETPSDALDALTAAGILPGWHYLLAVLAERSDANIADAADWVGALGTDLADLVLVIGQSSTSSIRSGTVPAAPAASDGASKTAIAYDDRDSALTAERLAARICRVATDGERPPLAQISCPPSVQQMTSDLSGAELIAATGRGDSQARCIAHGPLTPVSDADTERMWVRGYTVGGTLLDVEYSVARIKLALLVRLAQIARVRSETDRPLRTTLRDLDAVSGDMARILADFRDRQYLARRPEGDEALGIPAIPDGYTVSGEVGTVGDDPALIIDVRLGFAADVRTISITGVGYVG